MGINACPGFTATLPCTKILKASQAGLPNTLRKTYYGDWDPRLGFAWQPAQSSKTVVRGGAGIYTHLMLGATAYEMTGIHSSDVRTFSNQAADGSPLFTLPRISPGGLGDVIPGGESFGDGNDPSMKDPRVYQWSLTLEHELPYSNVLRASYVGSHATGMPVRVDLNQVPASTIPLNRRQPPFPVWSTVISLENLGFSSYDEASSLRLGGRYKTRNSESSSVGPSIERAPQSMAARWVHAQSPMFWPRMNRSLCASALRPMRSGLGDLTFSANRSETILRKS